MHTESYHLKDALDTANPNEFLDALRKVKLGTHLCPIKAVFTLLTLGTTFDITTAASKACAVVTGITLATGENLPPILQVRTLRVTVQGGGTAVLGARTVTDAAGTPAAPGATGAGIATISDNGKTLVFEGTGCTGFTLEYIPRSYTDPDSIVFAPST